MENGSSEANFFHDILRRVDFDYVSSRLKHPNVASDSYWYNLGYIAFFWANLDTQHALASGPPESNFGFDKIACQPQGKLVIHDPNGWLSMLK